MKRLCDHQRHRRATRGRRPIWALAACATSAVAAQARAGNDIWKTAANGTWSVGSNWTDGTAPGNADQATFNVPGSYTATLFLADPPAVQDLFVEGGANVRLQSHFVDRDSPRLKLNVTCASGGRDALVSGSGTTLTLGPGSSLTGIPLDLVAGDEMRVKSGSTLNVVLGSRLTAAGLFIEQSSLNVNTGGDAVFLNATIGSAGVLGATASVTGAGSTLNTSDSLKILRGTLTVASGAEVASGSGFISSGELTSGSVVITGAGSTWTAGAELTVAFGGGMTIAEAGVVSSNFGAIRESGRVTVSGDGSRWAVAGPLVLGAGDFGQTGTDVLEILDGGRVTVGGDISNPATFGTEILTLDGGTLEMQNHQIGAVHPIDVLHFRGGTLKDVQQINGGASPLNKTTAGTLVLDGTSTYTGGTIVSAGILQIGNGSTTGSIVGNVAVSAGSTLAFNRSDNGTFAGVISGGGDLNKLAGNVLTLTANNTYTGSTTVSGGTLAFATDYVSGSTLVVSDGAVVRIPQNAVTPNDVVLRTGSLLTNTSGRVDVTDNKLIVTGGSVGTVSGGVYTGLSGLIQSGRSGGAWDGAGITTSMPDAVSGLTSLGIATAAEAGYAGGTFGGISVVASDVLVMYTYAGDANLDGKINIDDYGRIDGSVSQSGSVFGWFNGDFNYDGKINIDDYGIIDGNINQQGAFITSLAAVSAVPEPTCMMVTSLAALLVRRRRHAVS